MHILGACAIWELEICEKGDKSCWVIRANYAPHLGTNDLKSVGGGGCKAP